MDKKIKKQKSIKEDINQIAFRVVQESTNQDSKDKSKPSPKA